MPLCPEVRLYSYIKPYYRRGTSRGISGAQDHAPIHGYTTWAFLLCDMSIMKITRLFWKAYPLTRIQHVRFESSHRPTL